MPKRLIAQDSTARGAAKKLATKHGIYGLHHDRLMITADALPSLTIDAVPNLAFQQNGGVPAIYGTVMLPDVIKVLMQPMAFIDAVGESQIGSWTDKQVMMRTSQGASEMSGYGDANNSGSTGMNYTFPVRGTFLSQTFTRWGAHQAASWASAGIDYIADLEIACADGINRFHNACALYGVAGAERLYGIFTDPNLSASITPNATGTGSSPLWANKASPVLIFDDFRKLFIQLQTQLKGNLREDDQMTIYISNIRFGELSKTNDFAFDLKKKIADTYKNLKFEQVPEMSTAGGEIMFLVKDTINGRKTMEYKFTVKDMTFPVFVQHSEGSQKHATGTAGIFIYYPIGVVSMIGF